MSVLPREIKENNIEWYTGSKVCTVSLHQKKYINRVRKMVKDNVPYAEIVAENDDGTVTAHIPLSAVHLFFIGQKNPQGTGVDEEVANG